MVAARRLAGFPLGSLEGLRPTERSPVQSMTPLIRDRSDGIRPDAVVPSPLLSNSKRAVIDFMCESGVLTFGDFVTKSGRPTPYFVNTGRYTLGSQMRTLGLAYARTITEAFGRDFDVLFGPAYKGIPLVVATAEALAAEHDLDVAICFNRKEAKDHGEGGVLVGHPLKDGDRVLIIEDVTTAGTSIRETVPILRAAAAIELSGLVISVDRMERGPSGEGSALEEVGREFSMRTESIVDLDDIVEYLNPDQGGPHAITPEDLLRIGAYRKKFGVPSRLEDT